MSQGDYINKLRVMRVLNKQTDLGSVLSSNEYTSFVSYTIANTVLNTVPKTYVNPELLIHAEVDKCDSYIMCTGTNLRPNRVITMSDPMGKRGYPQQHGYNEYLVNQKANDLIMPCTLFNTCDEYREKKNNTNKKKPQAQA